MSESVPPEMLISFFQEATKGLSECDLTDSDRDYFQDISVYRKRVLEVQRIALNKVLVDFEGVTPEQAQEALKTLGKTQAVEEATKLAMTGMNDAARVALVRLVLHQECIWDKKDPQRMLIQSGKIERKALMEFFGLCIAVINLPGVQKHMRDGSALFDDTERPPDLKFPQKRLEWVQRLLMQAVGYDADFGTKELGRIFSQGAKNEFEGDTQVHHMLANVAVQMGTAITNASLDITQMKLSDVEEGGSTRVLSVSYSERIVEPGSEVPQPVGVPRQQLTPEQMKHQLDMARKAAALQQSIMAELLQMDETTREETLKEAKKTTDEMVEKTLAIPPGPERVQFMTSMDPETERLLLMFKLWNHMTRGHGGKAPTLQYKK